MPPFEVTFMNHITTTHLVQAADEDAAWETEPEDVEDVQLIRWDCTSCEVTMVEPYPSYLTQRRGFH